MKYKKLLSFLIAVCLLLVSMPATARAATVTSGITGAEGDNVRYSLDSNGKMRIYGTGAMKDWTESFGFNQSPWSSYIRDIKTVVVEPGVTAIGDNAFISATSLTSVTIASTVERIGENAFSDCASLAQVTLPSALATVEDNAFHNTGITELTLPSGVTSLGEGAFSYTKVTSVVVPDGITTVSAGLFKACKKLESVTFQGAITDVGEYAFSSCEMLTDISFDKGLAGEIGKYAFSGCAMTEFDIPVGVKHIYENAFYNCEHLKEITFPAGLESIWSSAFRETALVSVAIPSTVTYIDADPFVFCHELKNVTMYSASVEGMKGRFGMDLEYVHVIGDAPQAISKVFGSQEDYFIVYYDEGTSGWEPPAWNGYTIQLWEKTGGINTGSCGENLTWTLDGDGLLTISGEGEMTEYPWKEEYAASITSVVIQEGVTSIRGGAFSDCVNLVTVEVPNTVAAIGPNAFNYCLSLETVSIPAGVKTLEQGVFMDCPSLTQIVIPNSVTEIGERAFCYTGLEQIEIPAGVTAIGETAFYGCKTLKEIVFTGDAPTFGANAFHAVSATAYYPAGNGTWTEDGMQNYGGSLTWEAREEVGAPWFTFQGSSVSMWDSLDMIFCVNYNMWDPGVYAVITRTYADGRENDVCTIPADQWVVSDSNWAWITYPNIAAKEMGDTLSVVIYDADGNAISETWEDSIRAYAMRVLEQETEQELLTLVVDMLNYGAAAQKQFGYDTANLVNADLTDTQKGYATTSCETEDSLVAGTGRYGTTLTLKSRITLDFIFSNSAIGSDYTGLYAIVTYQDHYGKYVNIRVDDVVIYDADHGCVSVPGLAVADYGQEVTCSVYHANGNALAWATDSMEGYAHRMSDTLPEIVDAIVKFGCSAYNYFH